MLSTLELLRGYREQIEADGRGARESARGIEYLDFFNDLVTRAINECERIAAGLRQGISPADLDALRQLASNASAEQRRCLMFRDKCINRPLPDERMRPLLNEISVTTRDQLTAFRDLNSGSRKAGRADAGGRTPRRHKRMQGISTGARCSRNSSTSDRRCDSISRRVKWFSRASGFCVDRRAPAAPCRKNRDRIHPSINLNGALPDE